MGNHDHSSSLEHFHLPCQNYISIKQSTPCFLLPPDPGNRYSAFCLCEFDCVAYLSGITQCICRFVPGLFHLASCPWGLSTLKPVSECHSYRLSVNGFLVCVCACVHCIQTTVCSPAHGSVGVQVVPTFWPLWAVLLWTLVDLFIGSSPCFWFWGVMYLDVDSLDQMGILFNTLRSHHTAFHSSCSLLPSLCTDVPVLHILTSTCYYLSFW